MRKNIIIFDTTLRDGEQAPGCQLNTLEKIEIAKSLDELGVDVIEAGFPVSSPGDLLSVQEISKVVTRPIIAALSRAIPSDIDAAVAALRFAKHKRIHTFISSSDIHIVHQFKSTRAKILEQAVAAVKYAKKFSEDVEFSAMDAGRTDNAFLATFIEAVIQSGATTVNIPDTTGYCLPLEFGEKIKYLFDHVRGIENVIVSVHCHNDLGLATANTIASVQNGARQIEVTVNGVGERAGNTSLEEVAMILKTREEELHVATHINTKKIYPISRLVSRLMRMPVQANKAIVGRNAFAHSSGIHQNGILKNQHTYEIMRPEDVGISQSSLSLTARSGRSALQFHLDRLGYKVGKEEIDEVYAKFLQMADKKKDINDNDVRVLMGENTQQSGIKLVSAEIVAGSAKKPRATISLRMGNNVHKALSYGNGPVDAAFRAVNKIVQKDVLLEEFLIQAISGGSDDLGKVHVQITHKGNTYYGFGGDTDIIVASVKAYIDALNKVV